MRMSKKKTIINFHNSMWWNFLVAAKQSWRERVRVKRERERERRGRGRKSTLSSNAVTNENDLLKIAYTHNDANNNSLTNFLYSNFFYRFQKKSFSIHRKRVSKKKCVWEREQLPQIWDIECGKSRPNGFYNRLQHRWMIEE